MSWGSSSYIAFWQALNSLCHDWKKEYISIITEFQQDLQKDDDSATVPNILFSYYLHTWGFCCWYSKKPVKGVNTFFQSISAKKPYYIIFWKVTREKYALKWYSSMLMDDDCTQCLWGKNSKELDMFFNLINENEHDLLY